MEAALHVHGKASVNELAAALSELPAVDAVISDDVNVPSGQDLARHS